MNKFWTIAIGAAAGLTVAAGVAIAQMPPREDHGDWGHGDWGHGDWEHGDWAQRDWEHGDRGPGRGDQMEWHHHHHPMMGMGGGTSFHFRKGDADIDIRCSPEESLQDCVSAATTLLDKLNAAPAAPKPPTQ